MRAPRPAPALEMDRGRGLPADTSRGDSGFGHAFHAANRAESHTLSDPTRRTVLGRLLALNHQRYAQDFEHGLYEEEANGKTKTGEGGTSHQLHHLEDLPHVGRSVSPRKSESAKR